MTEDQRSTEQRKQAAINRARKRLQEQNTAEWRALLEEEYTRDGLEYKPRLGPEDRAREQIAILLAQYPHLKEELQA